MPPRPQEPQLSLRFSPLAWLKLKFFLHIGNTEIGGFGVTKKDDALYIEDFVTVKQLCSSVSVEFDGEDMSRWTDEMLDNGYDFQNFFRIWIHTHPGFSPNPSNIDENTFVKTFGKYDWSLMFIMAHHDGQFSDETYARMRIGNQTIKEQEELCVLVDWARWPAICMDMNMSIHQLMEDWENEYRDNILIDTRVQSVKVLTMHHGEAIEIFYPSIDEALKDYDLFGEDNLEEEAMYGGLRKNDYSDPYLDSLEELDRNSKIAVGPYGEYLVRQVDEEEEYYGGFRSKRQGY